MTREETKQILMFIDSAYPNFHADNLPFLIDTWTMILENEQASEIKNALIVYTRTNLSGFAPSPAQLIEIASKAKQTITEEEAISLVRKAVANSLYHAQEEYEKLPPIVQKAVGTSTDLHLWAGTSYENFENIILSRFRKTFRITEKRELVKKEYQSLTTTTDKVRQLQEKIGSYE